MLFLLFEAYVNDHTLKRAFCIFHTLLAFLAPIVAKYVINRKENKNTLVSGLAMIEYNNIRINVAGAIALKSIFI